MQQFGRGASQRLFGGTEANFWNTSRGCAPIMGGCKPNPVSLQSWGTLATCLQPVGARSIVDMNIMTDTLSNQLATLQYFQSQGVILDYLELGNEIYWSSPPSAPQPFAYYNQIFPNASDYIKKANIWAASLRTRYPNAKIAAVGADSPCGKVCARACVRACVSLCLCVNVSVCSEHGGLHRSRVRFAEGDVERRRDRADDALSARRDDGARVCVCACVSLCVVIYCSLFFSL